MVLIVREELRLTPGKAAVQIAHAAVLLAERAATRGDGLSAEWLREGQKKIALTAPTLADLVQLERRARARGLLTVLVEDAGLTEVAPGTKTVLGIGPGPATEIDAITGDLPLL